MVLNIEDEFKIFESFIEPGFQKLQTQIQRYLSSIFSSNMVGFLLFHWYCHAHETGQFLQFQFWKSKDPIHPGKPLDSIILNICLKSYSFGALMYSDLTSETIKSINKIYSSRADDVDISIVRTKNPIVLHKKTP